jgi:hypothetical protein
VASSASICSHQFLVPLRTLPLVCYPPWRGTVWATDLRGCSLKGTWSGSDITQELSTGRVNVYTYNFCHLLFHYTFRWGIPETPSQLFSWGRSLAACQIDHLKSCLLHLDSKSISRSKQHSSCNTSCVEVMGPSCNTKDLTLHSMMSSQIKLPSIRSLLKHSELSLLWSKT